MIVTDCLIKNPKNWRFPLRLTICRQGSRPRHRRRVPRPTSVGDGGAPVMEDFTQCLLDEIGMSPWFLLRKIWENGSLKKMDLEMVETWVISLLWGSWFQFLSAMGFENSISISTTRMWDSKSQNEDSYATRTRIKTEKVEHNLDQIWILVAASPKLGHTIGMLPRLHKDMLLLVLEYLDFRQWRTAPKNATFLFWALMDRNL